MQTRTFGCFTFSGLMTSFFTLVVIAVLGFARGGVLFSPGQLNAQSGGRISNGVSSHAEIPRCNACHAPFWSGQKMGDRCLDCHVDLRQDQRDFHNVMLAESEFTACFTCHTDHHGPLSPLTILNIADFPHDKTGYSLQGHQHKTDRQAFTCSDCHRGDFSRFDQEACSFCHRDIDSPYLTGHIEAFGQDCLACHDGLDSYGNDFNHNRLAFPLDGKHSEASCVSCHAGATDLEMLQAAPVECVACHEEDDPHAGKFGSACGACHTSSAWLPAAFDHALSGFPLDGAHVNVACEGCHRENVFEGTSRECAACHAEPDYHAGLFQVSCTDCHSTEAWTPAKYDRAHNFPIDHGNSGRSSCQTCHPQALNTYTCYECHEHSESRIAAEHQDEGISEFQDCVRCHATGREAEEGDDEGDED